MAKIRIKSLANKSCLPFFLIIFSLFSGAYFPNGLALDAISKNIHGVNFYPPYPQLIIGPDSNKDLIAKGEYLVKIGDCISCHTYSKNGGPVFAGGLPIKTPFGTFFTPNITPDKETGIGNWSTQDFINAMHKGINPQRQDYFPVFPYTSFTKVSNQDLIAIKAYLNALPPVHQVNKSPTAPWPFSWRFSQIFWRLLFFKEGYYKYNPDKSSQWNRGAYLVQGLGHCGECHTPRNIMGAMKEKYFLTGAFIDGYWAPDITGLEFANTPHTEVVDVFDKKMLINKAGPVRGPMEEVDHNSLQNLSPTDLDAIALYLKTVVSVQPRLPKGVHKKLLVSNGMQVYKKDCAMCHDKGVAGAPMIYDTGNWTTRLLQGMDVLYQHTIQGFNNMPPRGGCLTCTDQDIKDAVNFIIENSQDTSGLQQYRSDIAVKPDTSIEHGKIVYDAHCAVCHNSGYSGAPKLGDQKEWQALDKNLDVLITNTITGVGTMPAKGGCKVCRNSDIIAAVKYMAQQGDPSKDYSLW